MMSIFNRLNESGVEVIEIGFLDERQPRNINRTIQPDTEGMSAAFPKISGKNSMVVAMIDYGTCGIDKIQPKKETLIDGIRVIFKKENMHKAISFGKEIMEKGYELFLNMVSITSYEEKDVIEFSEAVNKIQPFAISLVDTYGLMHKENMLHYFDLLDKYLDKKISIGYHSHNNFQLAYSNTIEMLGLKTERNLIVDGTLYGMGKSAGNAPTELLAMYMNENCGKEYKICQILEAIDSDILPIYKKHYWGYGILFYISSKNDCHPTFVEYLLNKKTLSIKDVDAILNKISPDRKLKFDKEYIENLYREHLLDSGGDSVHVDALSNELKGKSVLLIGPGTSVQNEREMIKAYISEKKPVVIGVNVIPDGIDIDYVFIRNPKRYGQMLPKMRPGLKVIATSNVTPIKEPFDYVIRYEKLMNEEDKMWDNTLVIILNILKMLNVRSISLAGFDGFKEDLRSNYVDKSFDLYSDFAYLSALNVALTEKIKEYRKDIDVKFITRSLYEGL